MKKVFICSPLRGEKRLLYERYARELCKYAFEEGFAPFAPHLLFTQMLDDDNPVERSTGIRAGKVFLASCDMLFYGAAWGISEGMKDEIQDARNACKPVWEIKMNSKDDIKEGFYKYYREQV
jgi:hypothetical protein